MGLGASTVRVVATPPPTICRLVMRRKEGLPELVEFVVAGLEAGQQVFALGGPAYLKDIACNLGASGLRPDSLLRTGRLVFLTAPDCLSTDRKSTRLNSSHSQISYAVFCLKKKKKKNIQND